MSRYWYSMSDPLIVKLRCLNFTRMEPYVVIRRHELTPLFHPYFINYGFNKISYVETLRKEEYRFVLAGDMYAFDLPHLPY